MLGSFRDGVFHGSLTQLPGEVENGTVVQARGVELRLIGLATILWCYLRSPKFKTPEGDMHTAADLTSQANHLGHSVIPPSTKLHHGNGRTSRVEARLRTH